jgi:predicted nucleotidyltransferase component of viral defense system
VIPRANITAWRSTAPWPTDAQVEQDLVLSRALVELFTEPNVAQQVLFRGGTALHKLFFQPPGRYSEDIDLVQRKAGPIGELADRIREVIDPWLDSPKWKRSRDRFTLIYRFSTTFEPVGPMRLKIEINTREHFCVLGESLKEFVVQNPWYSGTAALATYELDELVGTKLRALYQRKKGRDLYDLSLGIESEAVEPGRIIECFSRYLAHDNKKVSRAEFEANLAGKMKDQAFLGDIEPLIAAGVDYSPSEAAKLVGDELISKLPGEPWKGQKTDVFTLD